MKLILFILLITIFVFAGVEDDKINSKNIVTIKISSMLKELFASISTGDQSLSIATLDFSSSIGKAKTRQLGKTVSMIVEDLLIKDSRFIPVERKAMSKVVEEIALGQSGLINEDKAIKAGNILGATMIVTGSVAEIDGYFIVSARVVIVETGEILASSMVEIKQRNLLLISGKYVVLKKYSAIPAFQSAIIPGWGQLYNDQPKKAAVFSTLAVLSGGTLGFSYLFYTNFDYNSADSSVEALRLYNKWDRLYTVNRASLYACIAVWSVAVIDAFLVSHKNLSDIEEKSNKQSYRVNNVKPYLVTDGKKYLAGFNFKL